MNERPQRETVFAVPEQWVIVYRIDPSALHRFCLYATEADARAWLTNNRDAYYRENYIPHRATWQQRDLITEQRAKMPVWANCPWWRDAEHIWQDHGVRESTEAPGMVAYYQTPEKACLGLRTKIKPGRYLGKYFPYMPEAERARMARWQETGSIETEFTNEEKYPLSFATHRDDIREVYENGPDSCMSGEASAYETGGTHPCEVYGAGDLAIAYLTEAETDKVRARALCWPAKKSFGRVYPTPGGWSRDGFSSESESESMQSALQNRLLAMGHDRNGFDGAKLLKIECDDDDSYVMPYLDSSYRVNEHDDYFIMHHNGNIACASTSGQITIDSGNRCEHCESRIRRNDDYYTVHTRVMSDGRARGDQAWCDSCYENHTFFCEGANETFASYVESVEIGGNTYTIAYAEANFVRSDYSSGWIDDESDTVTLTNGNVWSKYEFRDHGFTCAITRDRCHENERHPDYPEIHQACGDEEIAMWLETQTINDERQSALEISL